MANWSVVGQVGFVEKRDKVYLVHIAENKYKFNKDTKVYEKEYTIWLTCICNFKPNIKSGDTIIAEGTFIPSKNENFTFALGASHIGVIPSCKDPDENEEKKPEEY